MIFRRLHVSDIMMAMNMNQDFRKGFICKENAILFLSQQDNWLFACIENDRIIGFCYGYELNRLNSIGNMLYIHEVGVLPEYQRQGIGKNMLAKIKEQCKSIGICRIFLVTEKSNVAACALYQSAKGIPAHEDDIVFYFHDTVAQ